MFLVAGTALSKASGSEVFVYYGMVDNALQVDIVWGIDGRHRHSGGVPGPLLVHGREDGVGTAYVCTVPALDLRIGQHGLRPDGVELVDQFADRPAGGAFAKMSV